MYRQHKFPRAPLANTYNSAKEGIIKTAQGPIISKPIIRSDNAVSLDSLTPPVNNSPQGITRVPLKEISFQFGIADELRKESARLNQNRTPDQFRNNAGNQSGRQSEVLCSSPPISPMADDVPSIQRLQPQAPDVVPLKRGMHGSAFTEDVDDSYAYPINHTQGTHDPALSGSIGYHNGDVSPLENQNHHVVHDFSTRIDESGPNHGNPVNSIDYPRSNDRFTTVSLNGGFDRHSSEGEHIENVRGGNFSLGSPPPPPSHRHKAKGSKRLIVGACILVLVLGMIIYGIVKLKPIYDKLQDLKGSIAELDAFREKIATKLGGWLDDGKEITENVKDTASEIADKVVDEVNKVIGKVGGKIGKVDVHVRDATGMALSRTRSGALAVRSDSVAQTSGYGSAVTLVPMTTSLPDAFGTASPGLEEKKGSHGRPMSPPVANHALGQRSGLPFPILSLGALVRRVFGEAAEVCTTSTVTTAVTVWSTPASTMALMEPRREKCQQCPNPRSYADAIECISQILDSRTQVVCAEEVINGRRPDHKNSSSSTQKREAICGNCMNVSRHMDAVDCLSDFITDSRIWMLCLAAVSDPSNPLHGNQYWRRETKNAEPREPIYQGYDDTGSDAEDLHHSSAIPPRQLRATRSWDPFRNHKPDDEPYFPRNEDDDCQGCLAKTHRQEAEDCVFRLGDTLASNQCLWKLNAPFDGDDSGPERKRAELPVASTQDVGTAIAATTAGLAVSGTVKAISLQSANSAERQFGRRLFWQR